MYKTFIKALAWNSSSTFLYKIILLSHQILLYSIIPKTLYGLQSSLFAIIYILITITNFGFDETLFPYFSTYTQSKQQFSSLCYQLILHTMNIACIAYILYMVMLHGSGEFLHNTRLLCNKNIILIISSIFFIESIKKSILIIMQLAFLNQKIAYAQLSMLSLYITTIWVFYRVYQEITLWIIFAPMLATTTIETAYCTYHVLQFWKRLPESTSATTILFKVLIKERVYNYSNQLTKAIYSPNSMTLLFTHLLGFEQAATIKFFTNLITLCYTCISKIVNVTTGATFAAMNQLPVSQLCNFFTSITKRYFQFLYLLTSLLICIVGYAWYRSLITPTMAYHILLFFSISFLEHMAITYEQLFISQGKARFLAIINLITLGTILISFFAFLSYLIGRDACIAFIIINKIISLWVISYLVKKQFNAYL